MKKKNVIIAFKHWNCTLEEVCRSKKHLATPLIAPRQNFLRYSIIYHGVMVRKKAQTCDGMRKDFSESQTSYLQGQQVEYGLEVYIPQSSSMITRSR